MFKNTITLNVDDYNKLITLCKTDNSSRYAKMRELLIAKIDEEYQKLEKEIVDN